MAREKKISQNPSIAKDELLAKMGFREMIDITKLLYNEGQIDGVPKNPRYLKESEHDKLVKSLADSPEFLEYKPLMVYGLEDGTYVTICGNMRLRVANELRIGGNTNFDKLPCFVLRPIPQFRKLRSMLSRITCKLVTGIGMSLPMVNGRLKTLMNGRKQLVP